jgi:hypothetical protein
MPFDLSSIMAPGRLLGMEMTASAADQIAVTAGTILMPNGILVHEDEVKYVQVSNTAFAANYTLTYQLEDVDVIGGVPASLNLIAGIVKQDTLTDSTVIGWVLYPGGAVALNDSHLVLADAIRVEPRTAQLDVLHLPPFTDALRPPTEHPGTLLGKEARFANLNLAPWAAQNIGTPSKILSATILPDTSLAANGSSYDTFYLKRYFWVTGTLTNLSPSITNVSDVSRIAVGQAVAAETGVTSGATVVSVSGTTVTMSAPATASAVGGTVFFIDTLFSLSTATQGLTAGVSKALVKNALPPERFHVGAGDTVTLGSATTVVPPPGVLPGSISYLAEVSGVQSGNWVESVVPLGTETASRWQNVGSGTYTYTLRFPFVVTGAGKLNKCVARLNVEANTIVTLKVLVGGSYITLSPTSGTVANTGGLKTVEFLIPSAQGVVWEVGKVAYVEVGIQAQPGGAAAIAYIGGTTENTPYTLFVGSVQ